MPNIVCNKPVRGAEDHRRFTGVAGVTQRGHRAWVCSALSKKELPHMYPAVTVPWKCGCVVFHAPGFKLKALDQLCPLELCPLCSSEGTELGTGSPVLRFLCQSDGKGTCQPGGPGLCVPRPAFAESLGDGDWLFLHSLCHPYGTGGAEPATSQTPHLLCMSPWTQTRPWLGVPAKGNI